MADGPSALDERDWAAAAEHFQAAVALLRGPALADFAYGAFAQIEGRVWRRCASTRSVSG